MKFSFPVFRVLSTWTRSRASIKGAICFFLFFLFSYVIIMLPTEIFIFAISSSLDVEALRSLDKGYHTFFIFLTTSRLPDVFFFIFVISAYFHTGNDITGSVRVIIQDIFMGAS